MSESLQRRAARIRQRHVSQEWERRQRHHTKGTWLRVQRILADAEAAYEISEEDGDALAQEGFCEEIVGHELHPPRRWFFVPADRVKDIANHRALALHLSAALLSARCLALVRWPVDENS